MYHEPQTGLQAKFSAEYWPAITLLHGRLGLREITDEVVARPEVQALVRKVKVYPDPSITVSTARVNIKVALKDGRTFSEAYFPAKGAADNPLVDDELIEKFNECAAWGGIPQAQSARALELLLALERVDGIDEVMTCLVAARTPSRSA
jgi:2-methylcitrate dehydratase PrpD